MGKIQALIDASKPELFTTQDIPNIDAQALGILAAHWAEWEPKQVAIVAASMLDDANLHTEAAPLFDFADHWEEQNAADMEEIARVFQEPDTTPAIAAIPVELQARPRYLDTAEVAKIVRQELKTAYPAIKFSVRSKVYTGGSSIRVSWEDGPTQADVRRITDQFQGADFDGMQDLKTYRGGATYNGERVTFGVDFIHMDRALSLAVYTRICEETCKRFGFPVPTIKASESGHGYYVRDWEQRRGYTVRDDEIERALKDPKLD